MARKILQHFKAFHGYANCIGRAKEIVLVNFGYKPVGLYLGHESAFFYLRDQRKVFLTPRYASTDYFLGQVGVDMCWYYTDDPEDVWELLRTAVDDGRPVLAWVDAYYLPFVPFQQHSTHVTILAGYDSEARTVWVADSILEFHGDLPWVTFCQALNLGVNEQNEWRPSQITYGEMFFREPPSYAHQTFPGTIDRNCRYYLNPSVIPQEYLDYVRTMSKQAEGPMWAGVEGMERFIGDLPEILPTLVEHFNHSSVQFLRLSEQRLWFGELLERAGELFGEARWKESAKEMSAASQDWALVRQLVAKYSIRRTDTTHAQLLNRLKLIQEREWKAYQLASLT